ncbi:hypothetical protein J7K50_09010 [bacterium]|nr:hypothetical protein [bacterium]
MFLEFERTNVSHIICGNTRIVNPYLNNIGVLLVDVLPIWRGSDPPDNT